MLRFRYWIAIIAVVALVLGSFLYVFIEYHSLLSVWANVVTAFTAVAAASYGTYQYLSIRKVQRQDKSAQIMQKYAERFVHRTALINQIVEATLDIYAIINKIDNQVALKFTREELLRFPITKQEVSEYTRFMQSTQMASLEVIVGEKKLKVIDYLPTGEVRELPKKHNLSTYIAETLNGLEHICMEIESGSADDNYLYGSVHHTFLDFIHNVAISIQNINVKSASDENYYPYISRTYRRWVEKKNRNNRESEKIYGRAEKRRDRRTSVL